MTELIWDGKYKDGKKVGPVRIELPFQTVETVNETAQATSIDARQALCWRRNRLAQSAHLGRQEICASLPTARICWQSQSDLY